MVRRNGFTIVELLVVIVVIAILATIATVAYNGVTNRSSTAAAQNTLQSVTKQLEVDKVQDGRYPTSLASANAGKGIQSAGNMRIEYTGNADTYCVTVGSVPAKVNYFKDNVSSVSAGLCTGHAGFTAGPGVVTVAGASLFGSNAPPATMQVFSDGGGGLWVGDRFYTSRTAGIRVAGLRVWEPAGATAAFLTQNVDYRAYMQDWTGGDVGGWNGLNAAVRSGTFTGTRTAGKWTDIMFATPITLPRVVPGATGADMLMLAVKYRGGSYDGTHYVAAVPPLQEENVESSETPGVYLSEHPGVGRGLSTAYPTETRSTYYGIDLIFEPL